MMRITTIPRGFLVAVAATCGLMVWQWMQPAVPQNSLAYSVYFSELSDSMPAARWHMVIYLDIASCLTCTEDMDAWRAMESTLTALGGDLSLWAPASDSLDVAEAMRLEGLRTPVRVLDPYTVAALGWQELGTPVKALLDNRCCLVKIAGRMGNVRASACFFDTLRQHVSDGGATTLAAQ